LFRRVGGLLRLLAGRRRDALVALRFHAIDLLPARPVVPLVGDYAVLVGRAAGGDGGVSGAGDGVGVGVMAISEPGPVAFQAAEAVAAVQLDPALRVVAAQLVEIDEDGQARRPRLDGRGKRRERED